MIGIPFIPDVRFHQRSSCTSSIAQPNRASACEVIGSPPAPCNRSSIRIHPTKYCRRNYVRYRAACLLEDLSSYMLKNSGTAERMLHPTNPNGSGIKRWWALMVLLAVCSLTVSVATRYTSAPADPIGATTTVRNHVAPEPGRQRLLQNAATWIPPLLCSFVFQAPLSYSRVVPDSPSVPNLLLEENLYNRPPPSFQLFA